jgi:ribosomal-protein-alanine N-acetyltransferase
MTRAVRAAVGYAFEDSPRGLGLHRLEANIRPENAASLAVARKVGFRHEGYSPRYLQIDGEFRDHARFALVREDWDFLNSAEKHKART